jgi:hypothetical protein
MVRMGKLNIIDAARERFNINPYDRQGNSVPEIVVPDDLAD